MQHGRGLTPCVAVSTRMAAIDQDPDQGDRDQDLPAEPHELVVAQPGQRAAQPDEDEQEDAGP